MNKSHPSSRTRSIGSVPLIAAVFLSCFPFFDTVASDESKAQVSTKAAPLSLAISKLADGTEESRAKFEAVFLSSQICVHLVAGADGNVVSSGSDPDGNQVLIAFADPPVFNENYGSKFRREFEIECNATMSGPDLIRTSLYNADSHGIRLNSAVEEVSIIMKSEQLTTMLERVESN